MKSFAYLTTFSMLLGACATSPSPTPGTASYSSTAPTGYTTVQDGVAHTLLDTDPRSVIINDGFNILQWPSSGATLSGFAATGGADAVAAAGLDSGTYFAGVSGTNIASSYFSSIGPTASYTGAYAFVVNGVDQHGPLALTANFNTGSLIDTSVNIDVNATISGASIDGTVDIGGKTGTLKGGFYSPATAAGPIVILGAAIGNNMAGIIAAN